MKTPLSVKNQKGIVLFLPVLLCTIFVPDECRKKAYFCDIKKQNNEKTTNLCNPKLLCCDGNGTVSGRKREKGRRQPSFGRIREPAEGAVELRLGFFLRQGTEGVAACGPAARLSVRAAMDEERWRGAWLQTDVRGLVPQDIRRRHAVARSQRKTRLRRHHLLWRRVHQRQEDSLYRLRLRGLGGRPDETLEVGRG